jgi:hypothetical protein
MKRFVMAIALTGLMSVTVLAGDIPINGAPAPAPAPPAPTTSSTLLTNVVLTIITTLIGR